MSFDATTPAARKAAQFFQEHAGYSYQPGTETAEQGRHRCALKMALAESMARDAGWYADWEPDTDADPMAWDGDGPMGEQAFGCILRDAHGAVLASLWGIWDPTPEYRRVVEAELAVEAHHAQLAVAR